MVAGGGNQLTLAARLAPRALILGVLLGSDGAVAANASEEIRARLQELAYREALFHHHLGDHSAAITRLQIASTEQRDGENSPDAELLLARLKLAYGLHDDTDQVLRRLLEHDVAQDQANKAWYELAQALFHKGYPQAANQALTSVRGRVPRDIAGPLQLLQGNVLMALRRYTEAAQTLERWRGPAAASGYAHFNRGIALLRAGEEAEAIRALRRVAGSRADDEERQALTDRANLTLGHIALRNDEPGQARDYFTAVRSEGPYSNRALLALGLVEQRQGRSDAALTAWRELRARSLADPAVQESYLAVPYALREQKAPEAAAQYEQAVASLTRELDAVNRARAAVQREDDVSLLLREAGQPRAGNALSVASAVKDPAARYLGRLMVSRQFVETSLGHLDLVAMLGDLEQGMEHMDWLVRSDPGKRPLTRQRPQAPKSLARAPTRPTTSTAHDDARPWSSASATPAPSSKALRWRDHPQPQPPAGDVPVLPEIELPAETGRAALPDQNLRELPESSVIGLPPPPEIIGPDEVDRLPPAPEVVGLPPASSYLPLADKEFAYPDLPLPGNPSDDARRRLVQRTTPGGAGPEVSPEPWPEEGLSGLSAILDRTDERIAQIARRLRDERSGVKDYRAIIAALRERARRLRDRIAVAIDLHQRFARALILDELEERQRRLEGKLAQARLELAKTYDLDTDTSR